MSAALGTNHKPGLVYAISDEGLELPVIDVTHPAFALNVSQNVSTLERSPRQPVVLVIAFSTEKQAFVRQAISKTFARRCEEALFADKAISSIGGPHF